MTLTTYSKGSPTVFRDETEQRLERSDSGLLSVSEASGLVKEERSAGPSGAEPRCAPASVVACSSGAAAGTSTTLARHGQHGRKPTPLCQHQGAPITPMDSVASRPKTPDS